MPDDNNQDDRWLTKIVIGLAFAALSAIAGWSLKTSIDNSLAIERLSGLNALQDQKISSQAMRIDELNASLNIVRQIVSDTRTLVMDRLGINVPK